MLFGDYSNAAAAKEAEAMVRNPANFNWTFIALLALVGVIYVNEIKALEGNCICSCTLQCSLVL